MSSEDFLAFTLRVKNMSTEESLATLRKLAGQLTSLTFLSSDFECDCLEVGDVQVRSAEDILASLREGGALVSASNCSFVEVIPAAKAGNAFLDQQGSHYILRSQEWLTKVLPHNASEKVTISLSENPKVDIYSRMNGRLFHNVAISLPDNPDELVHVEVGNVPIKSAEDILTSLREGGALTSANNCSSLEIIPAVETGNAFLDQQGNLYVLRSREWLAKVDENAEWLNVLIKAKEGGQTNK
jgi:hypothetical protein